jgi:hypothetical protein
MSKTKSSLGRLALQVVAVGALCAAVAPKAQAGKSCDAVCDARHGSHGPKWHKCYDACMKDEAAMKKEEEEVKHAVEERAKEVEARAAKLSIVKDALKVRHLAVEACNKAADEALTLVDKADKKIDKWKDKAEKGANDKCAAGHEPKQKCDFLSHLITTVDNGHECYTTIKNVKDLAKSGDKSLKDADKKVEGEAGKVAKHKDEIKGGKENEEEDKEADKAADELKKKLKDNTKESVKEEGGICNSISLETVKSVVENMVKPCKETATGADWLVEHKSDLEAKK